MGQLATDGRINHAVQVNMNTVQEGENTFPCTMEECGEQLVLIWDGEHFSLREEDQQNPLLGEIAIQLIEQVVG